MTRVHVAVIAALFAVSALGLPGCEKPKPSGSGAKGHDDHDHGPGDGHDHGGKPGDHGHDHDADVRLGSMKVGVWEVKVSRGSELKPGVTIHLDIELSGSAEKPAAVRAWIGTEDGKGSVRGKADASSSNAMDLHADVEAPSPIPAGAKLWIEIENAAGEKAVGGFDLKA